MRQENGRRHAAPETHNAVLSPMVTAPARRPDSKTKFSKHKLYYILLHFITFYYILSRLPGAVCFQRAPQLALCQISMFNNA